MTWEVWCQGHIDTVGPDHAHPRYVTDSWNDAQGLLAKAKRECQADAPTSHFLIKVEDEVNF